ncbi:MAG: DUF4252 domain-containing protein, partial [Maribacter sp.]|nr:DUF4252 domain-containing protein [Maribacter sp.]
MNLKTRNKKFTTTINIKIMRKIIIILVMAVLPALGFAQFDKYEDMDNVSAVVVNHSMFRLLSNIDVEADEPEAQDFMDIAKSLNNLRVFITEDKSISADMMKTMDQYLKSAKLEELMRVKDK